MPELSIIVPVYNAEKYLDKCLSSMLAQTFTDFELILVDDGSPDRSGEICDEYAARDGRIKVIHKENGGVSSARNAGLDAARGSFVLFCDSDDEVEPTWCELMHRAVENDDTVFAVCAMSLIFEARTETLEMPDRPGGVFRLEKSEAVSVYDHLNLQSCSNKIFSRRLLEENGIRFNPELSYGEDFVFVLEYFKHTDSIACVNIPLVKYNCMTPGSLTKRCDENFLQKALVLLDCVREILEPYMSCEEIRIKYDRYSWWLFSKALQINLIPENKKPFIKRYREYSALMKSQRFLDAFQTKKNTGVSKRYSKVFESGSYFRLLLYLKANKIKEKLK